jgi:hypothetical protein
MISWSGDIENYCNILPIFPIFLLAIKYCHGMKYITPIKIGVTYVINVVFRLFKETRPRPEDGKFPTGGRENFSFPGPKSCKLKLPCHN